MGMVRIKSDNVDAGLIFVMLTSLLLMAVAVVSQDKFQRGVFIAISLFCFFFFVFEPIAESLAMVGFASMMILSFIFIVNFVVFAIDFQKSTDVIQ